MLDEKTQHSHPMDHSRAQEADAPARLTAEEARQGRIILNTPARRAVFVAGLVGMFLLFVIGMLAS